MDKTLLKGLAVLEALSETDGRPYSIDELAERFGLSRSNVHRTLQTLMHAGYAVKDPLLGGYRSSMKMFELGARQLDRLDVRKLAPVYMARLATETGDTVHLSILEGLEVIYIEKIDSLQPVRAYTMVGGRAPAYAVATGKALLAAQHDGYLDPCRTALQQHTPATVTDCAALHRELATIRRTGYAINRGEWREGVGGLAAAVFDGLGKPVAALGVSGPIARMSGDRVEALAPLLVDTAAELSRAMGYVKPEAAVSAD
jgi:IclR family transcriptional regulator, KDG regulon repressor